MSTAELLLTALVALLVFGPTKLPMLAQHLGNVMRLLHRYQRLASQFWQTQLNEHQLQENLKKAEQADKHYQSDTD